MPRKTAAAAQLAAPITAEPAPAPQFRVLPKPGAEVPKKKGLDLSGLTVTKPATKGGKVYPIGSFSNPELVDVLLDEKAEYKNLKGTIASRTQALLAEVRAQIHRHAAGSAEDSHSIIIPGATQEALVSMTKRYTMVETDTGIIAAVGEKLYDEHFSLATSFDLDMEMVPDDRQQLFADAVISAARQLDCIGAVKIKQVVKPKPGFHAIRHSRLSVEENVKLDAAIPLVCSIRAH